MRKILNPRDNLHDRNEIQNEQRDAIWRGNQQIGKP